MISPLDVMTSVMTSDKFKALETVGHFELAEESLGMILESDLTILCVDRPIFLYG